MSLAEELGSDDELLVEIVFPQFYIDYNMATTRKFSAAIAHYCKAAAVLGQDYTEFGVEGMTVLQVQTIKEAMKRFGIEMEHEIDGLGQVWFCADVSKLRRLLEEEESNAEGGFGQGN